MLPIRLIHLKLIIDIIIDIKLLFEFWVLKMFKMSKHSDRLWQDWSSGSDSVLYALGVQAWMTKTGMLFEAVRRMHDQIEERIVTTKFKPNSKWKSSRLVEDPLLCRRNQMAYFKRDQIDCIRPGVQRIATAWKRFDWSPADPANRIGQEERFQFFWFCFKHCSKHSAHLKHTIRSIEMIN